MARYRHVANVYRKEPENPWWLFVIGGIIILALLGQCAG
jgi:hypothetical protein